MGKCLKKQEDVRFESNGGGGTTRTNILREGNKKTCSSFYL
jgi:hypothetical protein